MKGDCMTKHSDKDKLRYYTKRMNDEKLTQGQRDFALKRSDQLYDKVMKEEHPTFRHTVGGRIGQLLPIKEWFKRSTDRRLFFASRPPSKRKQQEINNLKSFEAQLERFMVHKNLNKDSKVFVVKG
jgi:hypothetical protein